jgi:aspartyl protease family protein
MLRSALGTFLFLAAVSLGFVAFVTRDHESQVSDTARSSPAPQPVTSRLAVAESVVSPSPNDQTVIAADYLGHFMTEAEVDGRMIRVLVDTGASLVIFTSEDAASLGLRPSNDDFKIQITTANGTTRAAAAHLRQIRIGNVWIYNVDALVSQRGVLAQSLLGMSALRKLRDVEFSAGRLVLKQ